MSKKEINNEIILLRGNVEQARVQIIRKLSRDAFKLRGKKGTEQQKVKNLRKADRIAAEILAIKKVKKDKITKYILANTLNFNEIVNDRKSEALTRIMARIANHKKFSDKIAEFKSKYPNYAEFLGPGRREKAILEWKERKKNKKAQNQNDDDTKIGNDDEDSNTEALEENIEKPSDGSETNDDDLNEDEEALSDTHEQKEEVKSLKSTKRKKNEMIEEKEDMKNIVKIKTQPIENSTVKKERSKSLLGKRKKTDKEESQCTDKDIKRVKKGKTDSTVISMQAVVKKFTDIVKEEESKTEEKPDAHTDSDKSSLKIKKEVDSFFFSGDGNQNYLSVAVPKNTSNTEEEEEYGNDRYNKKNFSRQQNDKFFSKVNKFQKNSNRSDARWEGQRDNERSYNRDKPGFNKFNGKQNDKFNSRPNSRFNGKSNDKFDNKSNNRFNDKFNDKFNNKSSNKFNDKPKTKYNDRLNNKFGNDKSFKKDDKDKFERKSNEVLHPSWEAKKKQQDVLKQGFQGKKIVFGDDF